VNLQPKLKTYTLNTNPKPKLFEKVH